MNPQRTMRRMDGLNLVELMIAMVIGVVLTFAVADFYIGNKQTFTRNDDVSRLQETAKAAIDVLGYNIRQAGYVDLSEGCALVCTRLQKSLDSTATNLTWMARDYADGGGTDSLGRYYPNYQGVKGCDKDFSGGLTPAWTCGTTGSNSLTIAYQAQSATFSYDDKTGQGGDCAGANVNGASASPQGQIAVNRFFLDAANKRLMCTGNGSTVSQPIADGVEAMELLYGIPLAGAGAPPNTGDMNVTRYVIASNVNDWTKVLAVRVCLQLVSPTRGVAPEATRYTDCAGAGQTATDGRLRQISRATFAIRNNLLSTPDSLP